MKIISNFKDYYDGAATEYGYANDIIFRRLNSLEIFKRHNNYDLTDKLKIRIPSVYKSIQDCDIILGVCGKLYPIMIYGKEVFYSFIPKDAKRIKELYDLKMKRSWNERPRRFIDICKDFLISFGLEKREFDYGTNEFKTKGFLDVKEDHSIFQELGVTSFLIYRNSQPKIENFRYIGTVIKDDYTMFLNEHNEPAFSSSVILNPILKDLQFTKVMDQFTLLQEIEMYMGRLSENNTPAMPVGSNKVIAESKGFDKWSFRKMPTKKVKK